MGNGRPRHHDRGAAPTTPGGEQMTRDEIVRPNIRRRVALAGGTALIAAAGAGGYLAMAGGSGSVRLTAVPTVVTGNVQAPDTATGTKAPDTDIVQQGGQ